MRILFLGNSFTYFNQLPDMAARLTGWETDSVTKGGAYLHEFLAEGSELNQQMTEKLSRGPWDYVVLQEQSFHAAKAPEEYFQAVEKLCALIGAQGAAPLLYATWPYEAGTEKLAGTGLSFEEMGNALSASFEEAARRFHIKAAPVGRAFERAAKHYSLYVSDHYHPSVQGTYLAALVIARAIRPDAALLPWYPSEMAKEEAAGLAALAAE